MAESPLMKTIITAVATGLVAAFLTVLLANKGMQVEIEANKREILDINTRLRVVETTSATNSARIDGMDKKIDDIWQVVVGGRPINRQSP